MTRERGGEREGERESESCGGGAAAAAAVVAVVGGGYLLLIAVLALLWAVFASIARKIVWRGCGVGGRCYRARGRSC